VRRRATQDGPGGARCHSRGWQRAESVRRRWSAQGESETRVDLQLEFRSSPSPVLSPAISVRVLFQQIATLLAPHRSPLAPRVRFAQLSISQQAQRRVGEGGLLSSTQGRGSATPQRVDVDISFSRDGLDNVLAVGSKVVGRGVRIQ